MSRVDDVIHARSRTATGLRLIGSTFVTLGLILLLGWVAVAGTETLLSRPTYSGFGGRFGAGRSFSDWLSLLRVLGYAGFCCTVGGFLLIFAAPRLSVIWLPFGRGRDCPRCMYPLADIPKAECPECGLDFSARTNYAQSAALPTIPDMAPLAWLSILRWTGLALIVGGLLTAGASLWGVYTAPGGTGAPRPSPVNGHTLLAIIMIASGAALAIWTGRTVLNHTTAQPPRPAPERI